MLELPTIKTDFLFENSKDFNQTTHARPQHTIVFIHYISLYFHYISSLKYLFKWSCHGHVMPFSAVRPSTPQKSLKCGKILMRSSEFEIFCLFQFSKWRLMTRDLRWTLKDHIHKYFAYYIILQLF